jgi:hypothetical protein
MAETATNGHFDPGQSRPEQMQQAGRDAWGGRSCTGSATATANCGSGPMARPSERYPGFFWVRGSRGRELLRIGATTPCIYCGMPILRPQGFYRSREIHEEDLHLTLNRDPRRVFATCWRHHHGCYAHYLISTEELLEAERIWVEESEHRPKPHPRDIALMQRHSLNCEWTGKRFEPPPLLRCMVKGRDRELREQA